MNAPTIEYAYFTETNWFCYWIPELFKTKNLQVLTIWYINDEKMYMVSYQNVMNILKNNKLKESIPFNDKLSTDDISIMGEIYNNFISDVNKIIVDTL